MHSLCFSGVHCIICDVRFHAKSMCFRNEIGNTCFRFLEQKTSLGHYEGTKPPKVPAVSAQKDSRYKVHLHSVAAIFCFLGVQQQSCKA